LLPAYSLRSGCLCCREDIFLPFCAAPLAKSGGLAGVAILQAWRYGIAGEYIVAVALAFFAFPTLLGWSDYGEKCFEYIMGGRGIYT